MPVRFAAVVDRKNSHKTSRKLSGSDVSLPATCTEGDGPRILKHPAVANEMIAKPLIAVKILSKKINMALAVLLCAYKPLQTRDLRTKLLD